MRSEIEKIQRLAPVIWVILCVTVSIGNSPLFGTSATNGEPYGQLLYALSAVQKELTYL